LTAHKKSQGATGLKRKVNRKVPERASATPLIRLAFPAEIRSRQGTFRGNRFPVHQEAIIGDFLIFHCREIVQYLYVYYITPFLTPDYSVKRSGDFQRDSYAVSSKSIFVCFERNLSDSPQASAFFLTGSV
jgi:hypothetical protein